MPQHGLALPARTPARRQGALAQSGETIPTLDRASARWRCHTSGCCWLASTRFLPPGQRWDRRPLTSAGRAKEKANFPSPMPASANLNERHRRVRRGEECRLAQDSTESRSTGTTSQPGPTMDAPTLNASRLPRYRDRRRMPGKSHQSGLPEIVTPPMRPNPAAPASCGVERRQITSWRQGCCALVSPGLAALRLSGACQ